VKLSFVKGAKDGKCRENARAHGDRPAFVNDSVILLNALTITPRWPGRLLKLLPTHTLPASSDTAE
jgi:hypothetical protein